MHDNKRLLDWVEKISAGMFVGALISVPHASSFSGPEAFAAIAFYGALSLSLIFGVMAVE